jgi:hypothetical protein
MPAAPVEMPPSAGNLATPGSPDDRTAEPGGSPNQPPAGRPDGGVPSGGERTAVDGQSTDISAARRPGGMPRVLWNLTVRQFISRYCKASINRQLPAQFEDVTIADMLDMARGGDAAARTCRKLLNEPRFRKE